MRRFFDEDLYALADPAPLARSSPRESNAQRAFVVFTGQSDWPWLRLLKPGYRHCFVLLKEGERWISIDPLLNHMEVQTHNVAPDFDLAQWLRDRGHRVVETEICRRHTKPAPFMMFTCVEAVKRVLGLHAAQVLTPWQLFRHLEKRSSPAHASFLDLPGGRGTGNAFYERNQSWAA